MGFRNVGYPGAGYNTSDFTPGQMKAFQAQADCIQEAVTNALRSGYGQSDYRRQLESSVSNTPKDPNIPPYTLKDIKLTQMRYNMEHAGTYQPKPFMSISDFYITYVKQAFADFYDITLEDVDNLIEMIPGSTFPKDMNEYKAIKDCLVYRPLKIRQEKQKAEERRNNKHHL